MTLISTLSDSATQEEIIEKINEIILLLAPQRIDYICNNSFNSISMSQQTKRAPGRPKKAEPQAAAPVATPTTKRSVRFFRRIRRLDTRFTRSLVEEVLLISFNSAVSPYMMKNRTLFVRSDTARTRTQYGWTSKAKMPKRSRGVSRWQALS